MKFLFSHWYASALLEFGKHYTNYWMGVREMGTDCLKLLISYSWEGWTWSVIKFHKTRTKTNWKGVNPIGPKGNCPHMQKQSKHRKSVLWKWKENKRSIKKCHTFLFPQNVNKKMIMITSSERTFCWLLNGAIFCDKLQYKAGECVNARGCWWSKWEYLWSCWELAGGFNSDGVHTFGLIKRVWDLCGRGLGCGAMRPVSENLCFILLLFNVFTCLFNSNLG